MTTGFKSKLKIAEIEYYNNQRPVSDKAEKNVIEFVETIHNGQPIDWDYWAGLNNITPEQAAKLVHHIDPILWPDDTIAVGKPNHGRYKGEPILAEALVKIRKLTQKLSNYSSSWTLVGLVDFVGEEHVSSSMAEAVRKTIKISSSCDFELPVNSGERNYTSWLREIWVKEKRPTGAPFFYALKKYKGQPESLVIEWWHTSPNGQGVKLKTNTGTIDLPKSQIQKIASKFKSKEKKQKNLSSEI
ncbi:MAG: hypothetical protein IPN42_18320 [Methylococcaceae bacterium]|nr:hypothetical protein [Methylococcaceae bacterium]